MLRLSRIEQLTAVLTSWPPRRWLALFVLLLALLYGSGMITSRSALIDGRRTFWLHDDMMISMRYARNLATGAGPVWNPGGERVEGYSNFGWLLIMAGVHRLGLLPSQTSLAMLLLNLILAGLVLVQIARLMSRLALAPPGLALPATLLALLLSRDLAYWTTLGLEMPLQTAVFLWLAGRLLAEAEGESARPLTYLLAGLPAIIRVDGLLLSGLLVALALLVNRNRIDVLRLAPLAILLPAAHVVWRFSYYGAFLPNTYTLKISGVDGRFWPGLQYASGFLVTYGPLWLLAGWGGWRGRWANQRVVRVLWLLGLPLLAYGIAAGGDDFAGQRFLAPWLPLLYGLAGLTLAGWRLERIVRYPATVRAGLLALFVVVSVALSHYNFWQGPSFEGELAAAGLRLRESTLPETSIGHFWAGTLPYFAERTAVDLLGKNDAVVARRPAHPGSHKPGHNKFDYAYSLAVLRPDLVVAPIHPAAIATPDALVAAQFGPDAYAGLFYVDPVFRAGYASQLILHGRIAIFVRADSPERGRLMTGDCLPVERPFFRELGLERVCVWE